MPICPFCRKNVDPNTVWCACGVNLSRYPNLPTTTPAIKDWLANYEPESLGSSQPEGSLLDQAQRDLINEQEAEISTKTKASIELSAAKKLIDDFLSDCQRAGLAPTIDIGQLRRDRWRQWRRIPTEYRQNPPLREFRLTPGYLFETSVAKFQDEFCLAIDGTVYKHQLNAPDPFPLAELLNQVPLSKLAEGLTFSLVWLLKAKQQPDPFEAEGAAVDSFFADETAARADNSDGAAKARTTEKKTGFKLPFGRKKAKSAQPPVVPFPVPAVENLDQKAATIFADGGIESAQAGSSTAKPDAKTEGSGAGASAGAKKTSAEEPVSPVVEATADAPEQTQRKSRIGMRLPFGGTKTENATVVPAPIGAADQTAQTEITEIPVKAAKGFKLPFSFRRQAVPAATNAVLDEDTADEASVRPMPKAPTSKATPVSATESAASAKNESEVGTAELGARSEQVAKTEQATTSAPVKPVAPTTSEPKPAATLGGQAGAAEAVLRVPSERDDGPIMPPLRNQKPEGDGVKRSFWPWGRKRQVAQTQEDGGATKTDHAPIENLALSETPEKTETERAGEPAQRAEQAAESKPYPIERSQAANSTSLDEKGKAALVPDEHGVTVYTKAADSKRGVKWPFRRDKAGKDSREENAFDDLKAPVIDEAPPASATSEESALAATTPLANAEATEPMQKEAAAAKTKPEPISAPGPSDTLPPKPPAAFNSETTATPPATPAIPAAAAPPMAPAVVGGAAANVPSGASTAGSNPGQVPTAERPAAGPPTVKAPAPQDTAALRTADDILTAPATTKPLMAGVSTPTISETREATTSKETRENRARSDADRAAQKEIPERKRRFWSFGRKKSQPEAPAAASTGTPKPMIPKTAAGPPVPGGGVQRPSAGAPRPPAGAPRPGTGVPRPGVPAGAPRPSAGARNPGAPSTGAERPRPAAGASMPRPGAVPRQGAPRPGAGMQRPGAGAMNAAQGAQTEQKDASEVKRRFWPFGRKKTNAETPAAPSTVSAPRPGPGVRVSAPRPGPGAEAVKPATKPGPGPAATGDAATKPGNGNGEGQPPVIHTEKTKS